jgi:hypothetical protein
MATTLEAEFHNDHQRSEYLSEEPEFMNYTPQTREERAAGKDKDALEKHRLQLRKEKFYVADSVSNPLSVHHDCPAFATEAERFNRDFAREDYEKRVAGKIAEEERFAQARTEQYYKEQDRCGPLDRPFDPLCFGLPLLLEL